MNVFRRVPRAATEVRAGEAASEPRRATPPCIEPIGRMRRSMVLPSAKCPGSAIIGTSKQRCLRSELDMAHEKLLRLLNLVWLLLAFPTVVAVLVGFMSQSPTLGIKTFLLIGFGIAILSPLL